MEHIGVVAHLLIYRITEGVVHFLIRNGIESHVGLLTIQTLHLDALVTV